MGRFVEAFFNDFWAATGQVFGFESVTFSAAAIWASLIFWGKVAIIVMVAMLFLYLAVTFIFG
jgi:hypothetical protein